MTMYVLYAFILYFHTFFWYTHFLWLVGPKHMKLSTFSIIYWKRGKTFILFCCKMQEVTHESHEPKFFFRGLFFRLSFSCCILCVRCVWWRGGHDDHDMLTIKMMYNSIPLFSAVKYSLLATTNRATIR